MGTSVTCLLASGKPSLHVSCEGPLGIPLLSLPELRSSPEVEAGIYVVLPSADMDHGISMEFQQGSQASSRVESCKSALLSSWKRGVRLPVELT